MELKYCLYARKSSESDERQTMSIDSQICEMQRIAGSEKTNIVDVITESKSAKTSGYRAGYMNLVQGLKENRFNAILTWAPDRLSRNAGDLGILVDLMDKEVLIKIRTHGQTFTNTPDEKFLLMILCSQAKLENDNRSKNVKRGMRARCEMGLRPGCVPLGYKLIRGEKFGEPSQAVIDEERAPHIKKMFDYVLKGYSGRQAWEYTTQDGFRTRNNKRVTLGMAYRILHDPFYYGTFEYPKSSGNFYKGNYEPIITKDVFDKVQPKLKTSPRGKWGRKEFYFSKLLKCGVCGSSICGTEHTNRYGSVYKYYRCNHSTYREKRCKEKYIREEKIIEAIAKLASKDLPKTVRPAREILHELDKINRLSRSQISLEDYLKDVLVNGNASEKAQVLRCIKGQLVLKGGVIEVR